jgi:predicted phage terminase large subunit-like protein
MKPDQLAAVASPADLAVYASHGGWVRTRFHDHLNGVILEFLRGQRKDRLLNQAPPRHGKTLLGSIYTAAWFLGTFPGSHVIVVGYSDEFIATIGRRVRNVLQDVGDELFGVKIADDSQAAHRFVVVGPDGEEGGMRTAGIEGPVTGHGGDLIILDDPVKNWAQATSETASRNMWDWYRSTLLTRLEPDGKIMVTMTRWAEHDLAGRILEADQDDEWEQLRIPALAEDNDPLGRAPGEALWPERFTAENLVRQRRALGNWMFEAIYQGNPVPREGEFFNRSTFRYWRPRGDQYVLEGDATRTVNRDECTLFCTMDIATGSQTGDWSVIATWAITPQRELLLLDRWRQRVRAPQQKKAVERIVDAWAPTAVYVESAGQQELFIAQLKTTLPMVQSWPPKRARHVRQAAKDVRANYATALCEAGSVYFPRDAGWLYEWERELLTFTGARNNTDDQVDAFSMAAILIGEGHVGRRQSLAGWTVDPDLYKPCLDGSYSYDRPRGSPNVGP